MTWIIGLVGLVIGGVIFLFTEKKSKQNQKEEKRRLLSEYAPRGLIIVEASETKDLCYNPQALVLRMCRELDMGTRCAIRRRKAAKLEGFRMQELTFGAEGEVQLDHRRIQRHYEVVGELSKSARSALADDDALSFFRFLLAGTSELIIEEDAVQLEVTLPAAAGRTRERLVKELGEFASYLERRTGAPASEKSSSWHS